MAARDFFSDPKDGASSDEDDEDDEAADDASDPSETGEYVKMYEEVHSFNGLLERIEKVAEEDDKGSYPPLKGNLYLLMFVGRFSYMRDTMSILGFLSITCIQIFAPFAMMFWALHQINWEESTFALLSYEPWSEDRGISHLLKVLLSVSFLFCFALNGLGVVKSDHEMNLKLKMLIRYADPDKSQEIEANLHYHWLGIGRLINASLPITCSICLFFLFILAEQPKDVVFDSLGMTFLYTLDDIDGPLGLLSTSDWDEELMGRFYFKMVNPEVQTEKRPKMALVAHKIRKYRKLFGSPIFMNAAWVMRLLAFILPLAFFFTDGVVVFPQN